MRLRICEHQVACIREDSRAIDGGEPTGCTMPPCDDCGAICPASTWTRSDEIDEEVRELNQLLDMFQRNKKRAELHRQWKYNDD